ncbi:hypothetical protein C8N24_0304 [Solirubrobacter pauli]|uniref:Uncharacterized protein n=1 Tax=Solirubrobacter pauli TaxID=166793 RepID=A0A660L7M4_9ACTN|nr:hypothetical protein [Solirubrobacter pauli]RKQ90499.1 hypothetical protein C8N24_0304 [Solirubrobacter pauli]
MRPLITTTLLTIAALTAGTGLALGDPAPPRAKAAAVCADFPNQAAAQQAANTIDADRDGLYCESLPCPCLKPGAPLPPSPTATPEPSVTPVPTSTPTAPATEEPTAAPEPQQPAGCSRPSRVQSISFSKTKYPNIKRHTERAIRQGWPAVLALNRPGADARRERLLEGRPTRQGHDRDEYPPAVGRGRGSGLTKGTAPVGWKASVAFVPSSENRSHGSTMGIKLRRFCDGTQFKYVFY